MANESGMADAVALALEGIVSPVLARLAAVEATLVGDRSLAGRLAGDVATLRQLTAAWGERLAVVETRGPVPGPPGVDGKDGADGTNGLDGLGFDDLSVTFDDDRTIVLSLERGDQVKAFPIVLPFLRYQGYFNDGAAYTVGDVVTWAGSLWHCKDATSSRPGDGVPAWRLMVKKGRDGRDAGAKPK